MDKLKPKYWFYVVHRDEYFKTLREELSQDDFMDAVRRLEGEGDYILDRLDGSNSIACKTREEAYLVGIDYNMNILEYIKEDLKR